MNLKSCEGEKMEAIQNYVMTEEELKLREQFHKDLDLMVATMEEMQKAQMEGNPISDLKTYRLKKAVKNLKRFNIADPELDEDLKKWIEDAETMMEIDQFLQDARKTVWEGWVKKLDEKAEKRKKSAGIRKKEKHKTK